MLSGIIIFSLLSLFIFNKSEIYLTENDKCVLYRINTFDKNYNGCKDYNGKNSLFIEGVISSHNRDHKKADSLLRSFEKLIENKSVSKELYYEFELAKQYNNYFLGKLRLKDLDKLLKEIDSSFYPMYRNKIKFLILKVICLRNNINTDYAFSTVLYALYLSHKKGINFQNHYSPEFQLSVGLFREGDTKIYKSWMKSFVEKLSDNHPYSRLGRCFLITRDGNKNNLDTSFLSSLLNHNNSSPYEDYIIQNEIIESQSKNYIYKQDDKIDFTDVYKITIAIDALIRQENLIAARNIIDKVDYKNFPNPQDQYLLNFRKAKLFLEEGRIYCDKSKFNKALRTGLETIDLAKKRLRHETILHLSDFMYFNNNLLLESNFEINKKCKSCTIELLSKIKENYNTFSKYRFLTGSEKISEKDLNEYGEITKKIENLELQVNHYQEKQYSNLSVFKDLYSLHKKRNDLEKKLKKFTSNKGVVSDYNSAKVLETIKINELQVFDFIATDSNYYMTYLNPDTMILSSFLKKDLNQLIENLDIGKKQESSSKNAKLALSRLFSILSPYLNEKYKNIVIIPDQDIVNLPFEMISYKEDINCNPLFLVDYFNISYTYNIKNLENLSNVLIPAEIVSYSYSDYETLKDKKKRKFTELPIGFSEANEIAQLYKRNKTYSGLSLSKKSLFINLHFPILHFSTHSSTNYSNIYNNYLLVRNEKGSPEKMYGFEIKNRHIDKSLVILSSCNNGTGTYKPGAGTFSLSRDFLQAGAQTVIKSLWAVNEVSTAELMVYFHKNLIQGYSASKSLTLAKRKLKKKSKYAHPYYWAGFVLEGNPNVTLDLLN